jgi:flagellar protein FliO/FliZ
LTAVRCKGVVRRESSRLAAYSCAALALLPQLAAAAASEGLVTGQLVRFVIGLAVVVVLLLLLARLMTKLGGGVIGGRESFRVLASLPVGQRERVIVLQVGQQQIVLGVAPGRVNLVHRLEEPLLLEASAAPAEAPAYTWLTRALGGRSR